MGFYEMNSDTHYNNIVNQLKLDHEYKIVWEALATNFWMYEKCHGEWDELALIDNVQLDKLLKEVKARGFYVKIQKQTPQLINYFIM